ncbi:MAG TPA: glucokinase, partial [Thermoanaerobaculia bacterium]|nr:glucokinase [Thermoanaerobaculia bacterium]
MRVLAGDIGGTKTAMAVVEISGRRLKIRRSRRYPSGKFASLEEIVVAFLRGHGRPPRAAGFGVAGPVR